MDERSTAVRGTARSRPRQDLAALARGGSLNLVGAASAGLLQFALVVVVTNGFPQREAGLFFAATATFLILNALAQGGAGAGVMRWVPAYLVTGRRADVPTCLRVALASAVVGSVLLATVVWIAAPQLAVVMSRGDDPAGMVLLLRVLALLLPVAAAYEVMLAGTRAHGTMRPTVLIDNIGRMGAQPLAVLVVPALGAGLVALALAWSAPYLLATAAAAWALRGASRRRSAQPPAPGDAPARPWLTVAIELWRYTSVRTVARICQSALQRSDIILVAALRSPAEAAIYTAATRLAVIGQLGGQAMARVLQPTLSRLLALGERDRTESVFQTSTVWCVALTWPVFLSSAALAPVLLPLFGEGYVAGTAALVILCSAMLVATAAGPVDVALVMGGRSTLQLLNIVVALIVNVALNVLLIPRFGITGAAVAWGAAILTTNLMALAQVHRHLGLLPRSRGLAWVTCSAALCFGVAPLALRLTVEPGLPVIAGWLLACAGAYTAILWRHRDQIGVADVLALYRDRRGRRRPADGPTTGVGVPASTEPVDTL